MQINPNTLLRAEGEDMHALDQQLQENNQGAVLPKEEEIEIIPASPGQIGFTLNITRNNFLIKLKRDAENAAYFDKIEAEMTDSLETYANGTKNITLNFQTNGNFKLCNEVYEAFNFSPEQITEDGITKFDPEKCYGFILNNLIYPILSQLVYQAYSNNCSPEVLQKIIKGEFAKIIDSRIQILLQQSLRTGQQIPLLTMENLLDEDLITIFKNSVILEEIRVVADRTNNHIVLEEIIGNENFCQIQI